MRRSILLAAVLAVLAPGAAAAQQPAVTLETKLGKPDRRGGVKQTLSWNASCPAPTDEIAIGVAKVVALKGRTQPGVGPVQWLDDARPGAGSFTMAVLPGVRWKPRVVVHCRAAGTGEERTAFAEPEKFGYLPPRLLGWQRNEGEVCGIGPGREARTVQARMWARVEIEALYDEDTLLKKADKGIDLVVRGGGLRTRVRLKEPASGSFDDPEQFLRFELTFKRPGKAKLWLEFDGDRSNSITIPIARLPRGCGEFATG